MKAAYFDENDEFRVNRHLTLTAYNAGWEIWFEGKRIAFGETKTKGQARKNLQRYLFRLYWSLRDVAHE